jgi:hypothetical protein
MKNVSNEQVVERMRHDNPWWRFGSILEFHNEMKRRPYFKKFFPLVSEKTVNRAIILMGPRRVGKSVMLHHSIQSLIDLGVSPTKICYVSINSPVYAHLYPEELMKIAMSLHKESDDDPFYMFFDEIQYMPDWELHLKDLVDAYRHVEFIVSGSAAAALRVKGLESGAGRFSEFLLPPLSFYEYIEMSGRSALIVSDGRAGRGLKFSSNDLEELNRVFIEYLNYGGYPEVIFHPEMQSEPGRYIKADILDKVLLRDLPSLFGIQDIQELYSFFTFVAFNSGNEVSPQGLSENSRGVKKALVNKYLEYLEAAFLLRRVKRLDQGANKFRRDNFFKLYLCNPSLRAALFSPLSSSSEHIGNMVETVIYAQWFDKGKSVPHYARWQRGEVDMVMLDREKFTPSWALEIKWSDRYLNKPGELKSLINFCVKNELDNAWCTTINLTGDRTINNVTIHFLPAAIYTYTLGYYTLNET